MERAMNTAHYANKAIIKYFSKKLDEFRREMKCQKEIIMSDVLLQGIPEEMHKRVTVNMQANPLTQNFQEWSKNT